jgi:3D (Asp-Asp-Asp) domain-containing protein
MMRYVSKTRFLTVSLVILATMVALGVTTVTLLRQNQELKTQVRTLEENNGLLLGDRSYLELKLSTLERSYKTTLATIGMGREQLTTSSRGSTAEDKISLIDENNRLRETLSQVVQTRGTTYVRQLPGKKPDNLNGYIFAQDVGDWKVTYYTPSKKECGNTEGIGASGKQVIPGYSIAIDPKYWKYGTMFYVEGLGIVRADDAGSAIKGKNRLDYCILNSEIADRLGAETRKVWLLKER